MKKLILFILLCTCIIRFADAQTNPSAIQPVLDIVKGLQAVYTTNPTFSFHVLYTFADKATPDKIEDSVAGLIQISNNRYDIKIGPTETISDSQYAVMLFSEDKVMYITKPSKVISKIDPLTQIDSALLNIKGLQSSVETENNRKVVKISFPSESAYKSIWLSIDNKTGYLLSTKLIIKEQALPGDQSLGSEDNQQKNGYAIITASYSGYSKDQLDDSLFNVTKYFIRSNKNFSTTEEFKDYKIFIGSPNL